MKVAVVGCLHGELDIIYERIAEAEQRDNIVVDLLLICGDFQATRNQNDLKCMAVPDKYKQLGTFHRYYFGEKLAPKLTLLIGGNHEASNYMQSLPYGGWIAPNMYYLGYSSVVQYGGLRIGGISGIFKPFHAKLGHYESLPYDEDSKRSIYHTRASEIYKLLQLTNQRFKIPEKTSTESTAELEAKVETDLTEKNGNENSDSITSRADQPESHLPLPLLDVFISHDWPVNIYHCGNVNYLLRKKPYFREDIDKGKLGSPDLGPLVPHLKPKHWFAAHLHVEFRATVTHQTPHGHSTTEFQALDKVLRNRSFLKFFDIFPDDTGSEHKMELKYDPEWLAILKKTDHLLTIERQQVRGVNIINGQNSILISDEDIQEINTLFNGDLTIPQNFAPCEPVPAVDVDNDPDRRRNVVNPQTSQLCEILSIRDPNQMLIDANPHESKPPHALEAFLHNPDEINLSDSDCESEVADIKKAKLDGELFFIDTKGGTR